MPILSKYLDWTVVGINPGAVLVASGTGDQDPAVVYDLDTQEATPEQALQIWYKWSVYEPGDGRPLRDHLKD